MTLHTYVFRRLENGTSVKVIRDGERPRELDPRHDLSRFTMSGSMDWGHGGFAAAQTALAVLADFFAGENDPEALRLYPYFKRRVIARRTGDWRIRAAEIAEFVEAHAEGSARLRSGIGPVLCPNPECDSPECRMRHLESHVEVTANVLRRSLDELRDIGRAHPAAFIGAAVAIAGLALRAAREVADDDVLSDIVGEAGEWFPKEILKPLRRAGEKYARELEARDEFLRARSESGTEPADESPREPVH